MTLTELRYLVNLDKERHFLRAAERSFVSQPTLSLAVRKLEDELGVVLFERARGEVRPTPVGVRIIAQAKRILSEASQLEDIAREGNDALNGPLRVGAIYTVGPSLLPPLVPWLHTRYRNMPLVIEENFTAQLLEQLRDHELDVAILALPVQSQGILAWPIYDEDFVVLLSPGHPWMGRSEVDASKLAEQHLLLLGPGHCFRDQVISACPNCVEPDRAVRPHTGSSLETIRHMVSSGLGITVLPRSSVESRTADSDLPSWISFSHPAPSRRIALIWRRSFPRMEAVRALREGILSCGLRGVTPLRTETPRQL